MSVTITEEMLQDALNPPRILGETVASGRLRASNEDFQVDEILGFEPDGEGEQQMIQVRKSGLNSEELSRKLARHAGIPAKDVGFAGLKDRNAVTTQWFTLRLAGKPVPDWKALEDDRVEVLQAHSHRRKLRRGSLKGNRFTLRITDLSGDLQSLEPRLKQLQEQGVPNYFGEQRFGREGRNLQSAAELFFAGKRIKQRHLRSLFLSSARSWLFNSVLAERVRCGSWNQLLPGEMVMLEGSHSVFLADRQDAETQQRLTDFDIHPTGPLWGQGVLRSEADAAQLERDVLMPRVEWLDALEKAGLKQERRALRLKLTDLQWELSGSELVLRFSLPAGAYATVLVSEILNFAENP